MIYLYQGTPGSGKSFHAVSKVWDCLKNTKVTKTNVIANFPVDLGRASLTRLGWIKTCLTSRFGWKFGKYNAKPVAQDQFFYLENSDMTVDYLHRFCDQHHKYKSVTIDGVEQRIYLEDQTYVIIDEATILFNCRGWQDKGRQEWCKFFSQHRKFGFNIIMIAQDERMLDKQIRYNVEVVVNHRNAKYFNTTAKILSFLCGGSLFIMIYTWNGCHEVMKREMCKYRPRIASIYNSYLIFAERDTTHNGTG